MTMTFPVSGIPEIISAIGALGTASFALVDTSKVLRNGGVSNSGFGFIETAVRKFLPEETRSRSGAVRDLLDVLHGNWINGMALADQKAVAKSLVKLRLTQKTAPDYADVTGVDPATLAQVADLMVNGVASAPQQAAALSPQQSNVLGRFDLSLTALLDASYQKADQCYRNRCRVWAMAVSVALALFAGWSLTGNGGETPDAGYWLKCLLGGLLATPLAPVAKDLASALSAAVNVAQSVTGRKR